MNKISKNTYPYISIHTLRMEGDYEKQHRVALRNGDFNPHPPHGG